MSSMSSRGSTRLLSGNVVLGVLLLFALGLAIVGHRYRDATLRNNDLVERVNTLEQKRSDHEFTIDKLKTDGDQMKSDVEKCQNDVKQQDASSQAIQTVADKCRNDLVDESQKRQEAESSSSTCSDDLDEKKQEVLDKDAKILEQDDKIQDLQKELQAAQQQAQASQQELEQLKSGMNGLAKSLDTCKASLASKSVQAAAAAAAAEVLKPVGTPSATQSIAPVQPAVADPPAPK